MAGSVTDTLFENKISRHPLAEAKHRNPFALFTAKLRFAFTALGTFLGIDESIVITAAAEASVSDNLKGFFVAVNFLFCINFYKIFLLYDGPPPSK